MLQLDAPNSRIVITNETVANVEQPVYTLGMLRLHSPACSFSLQNNYMVKVSFWSTLVDRLHITAYRCSRNTEVWTHVFNPKIPLSWDIKTTSHKLTPKACEYMTYYRVSPLGQPLVQVNTSHFDTSITMMLNNTMLLSTANWTLSVVNYHLQLINLTIDHQTGSVQSPDIQDMDYCDYQDSHCYDKNDVIVWNVQDKQSCTFRKQEAQCYLSENQLVCPSLMITVLDYLAAKHHTCGTPLGVTRSQVVNIDPVMAEKLIDANAKYRIAMKFSNIYNSIFLGTTQHLQVFHISSCGSSPSEVQIDGLNYQPTTLKKPFYDADAEFFTPPEVKHEPERTYKTPDSGLFERLQRLEQQPYLPLLHP